MESEMRTLTPEVARFYATSLGDVFTPDGDVGVIDWVGGGERPVVRVVGRAVDRCFAVEALTYNHTDYLQVVKAREREGL